MVKSNVTGLSVLLKKSIDENLEVLEQSATFLTAPGEHYGSVMLALKVLAKIKEKKQTYNLVAKLIPANEMLRTVFDISVTFKKEIFAYTITIPTLTQFQKEYNFQIDQYYDRLFPKCYGGRLSLKSQEEVDNDAVILFENLKLQGYKTEDRLKGVEAEAAKIVLQDLARFHAIPIAFKMLKPDEFNVKVKPSLVRNKGIESFPKDAQDAFHNSVLEGARKILELQLYVKQLEELIEYTVQHPYTERPPPKEPWGSISHSDFWTSNTMLLRDKNRVPLRNKIVDLQLNTYSSIVRDLLFFMYTSIVSEDLDQYYDDFIHIYYDSFKESLEKFPIDTTLFSFKAFLEEIEEVGPTEVYHILCMLKPICTEPEKVKNNLEDIQDSEFSDGDLLGPAHQTKLKNTVLALAKRGWI